MPAPAGSQTGPPGTCGHAGVGRGPQRPGEGAPPAPVPAQGTAAGAAVVTQVSAQAGHSSPDEGVNMQRRQHLDDWVVPASGPWAPPSPDTLQSPCRAPRVFPPASQVPWGVGCPQCPPAHRAASCGAGLGPGEAQRRGRSCSPDRFPGVATAQRRGAVRTPSTSVLGHALQPCLVSVSAGRAHAHAPAAADVGGAAGPQTRCANLAHHEHRRVAPPAARSAATQRHRQGPKAPQRRDEARCAHLSSRKLVAPRWKKPTAMQMSLVTAWSKA